MTTDIGLKYFSRYELQCKGSGEFNIAPGFGEWIDSIREEWGMPLTVNSCCRNTKHNKKVGGKKHSYHLTDRPNRDFGTCAIDFRIYGGVNRRKFVEMIIKKFPEASIGVNRKFIHIDRRSHYEGVPPMLFTY